MTPPQAFGLWRGRGRPLMMMVLVLVCGGLITCLATPPPPPPHYHHHHLLRHRHQSRFLDEEGEPSSIARATVIVDGSAPIAQTRPGYINLNVEYFAETFPPLANPKVRFLISQLAPATLRIGGNSADTTTYAVNKTWEDLCSVYPGSCFTPNQYQDLMTFCHAVGWGVLFNMNEYWTYPEPVIDPDTAPRTKRPGPFKNENNVAMLEYMAQVDLVPGIVSLGNELTDNLSPEVTATDYKAFWDAIIRILPDETKRPKLIGPDAMWQNQSWAQEFIKDENTPPLEAFGWHMYLLNRTAEWENILNPAILDSEVMWAVGYREAFEEIGKPQELWLTETGVAWGGELNGTADRFVGGFWWLDQLGLMATLNVTLQHRHTIFAYTEGWASSFLGTVEDVFEPRPDYWTSLLWGRLVGTKVLNATKTDGDPTLRVYAHCAKSSGGGITLVVVNLSPTLTHHLAVEAGDEEEGEGDGLHGDPSVHHLYLLSAPTLDSKTLQLNGRDLSLIAIGDEDYAFSGLAAEEGQGDVVVIPPLTYGFIVLPLMEASACTATT